MKSPLTVGFLHPGAMGAALAACCVAADRLWVAAGRSEATVERAAASGLTPVSSLRELTDRADVVVSICPPAAAMAVAEDVADARFKGIYVEANAIAPNRSRMIAERFDCYVDASVIGSPPTAPGTTRLYLSGPTELTVAVEQMWAGSILDVRCTGTQPGEASALKMAYAGWTKGSAALLLAVAALAESEGVSDALRAEWEMSQPDLAGRLEASATRAAPKAWRFAGEMEEIAATLAAADLPAGFHLAAAELYKRLAGYKDGQPSQAQVLAQLLGTDAQSAVLS